VDKIGNNEVMGSLPHINATRGLDLDCSASGRHSGLPFAFTIYNYDYTQPQDYEEDEENENYPEVLDLV